MQICNRLGQKRQTDKKQPLRQNGNAAEAVIFMLHQEIFGTLIAVLHLYTVKFHPKRGSLADFAFDAV